MAEVLSNIAASLIASLGSSAVKELGVFWGLNDELDKLKRTISTVESVLLYAEEQSIENPQLKIWVQMLTEAMYDADDLLDEFSTEALRQQAMGGSETAKKVRLFFSGSNQFAFGLKMGHKVRELRLRLDEIAAEKSKFHLENGGSKRGFAPKSRDQTHSSPPLVVVGRERDRETIAEVLMSSDCVENVSVVAIVGIGGLGKTTLAQMLYNDVEVENHFEFKMWVCVSDEFDLPLLVSKVLESATGENVSISEMESLKNRLHERINGKKFLLVLDDVWNEDSNKWCSFRDLFGGSARGSRIVITTRLRTVSETSRAIFIHELGGLTEREAWLLFKEVAFKQGRVMNPSIEAMGKDIVGKCCGVPLAVKTIGGMLYFKDSESEWLLFRDKELSKINVFKDDILPILRLSYNHLPPHYKHCFAYCCLYPKDVKIRVEDLVCQWRALGFIESNDDSNECVRDIGYRYIMDLFRLSFFQDVEKDELGRIVYCNMHDLMHDLAISVAGEYYFAASISEMTQIKDKTQHVSFRVRSNPTWQDFSSLLKAKKTRTVLRVFVNIFNSGSGPFKFNFNKQATTTLSTSSVEDEYRLKEELDAMFRNLRCLRVLNLCNMGITTLPSSIHKLKHLRYLDLSHNVIKKLPSSVADLPNLEVLNLNWCWNVTQLPSNITKLVNLTELDLFGCSKLSHMPQGIGKLTRLEKLPIFVIAKDHRISKDNGGLDELHSLNNLRGGLKIANLGCLKNVAFESKAARLSLKDKLEQLSIYWGDQNNSSANEEMAMEALCPNRNLKELTVEMYGGVKPPSWLPSLNNLVSVTLSECKSIQWLPPLDQLPCLERLFLSYLTKLERIDVDYKGGCSAFFQSLKSLTLVFCPNLKGFGALAEELPDFPSLSVLDIRNCPNLARMPLFSGLKRLCMDGNALELLRWTLETRKSVSLESSGSGFGVLSQLEDLRVSNMKNPLEDELLQCLQSLQHLHFGCCPCESVCSDDESQWRSLKALSSVEFHTMENLAALPKGLRYVSTLRRLQISHCRKLVSIPEWMPELVGLQDLTVRLSSQLEARCKNNSAEDWPKISHIPNISVDYETIQRNVFYLL